MKCEDYLDAINRLPAEGKHIIGYQTADTITVYQAYNESIAEYAAKNQVLGGPDFSYNRMSWIKPGFLWMMYRSGWASKENQERILAIEIGKADFLEILSRAIHSTFKPKLNEDSSSWNKKLKRSDVVLQWDPDHEPFGEKLQRRAIQLGLRGDMLEKFGKQFVRSIHDITEFVQDQHTILTREGKTKLRIPYETIFEIDDSLIRQQIGL